MRTDKQKVKDAKEVIASLSVKELREALFLTSALLELRFLDSVHPILDTKKKLHNWLDTTWSVLADLRTEEHMQELTTTIDDFVRAVELVESQLETKQ
jgi:hypothetical protein